MTKFLRQVFESKKLRRYLGIGLTAVLAFSGLISNAAAAYELGRDETINSLPENLIVTVSSLNRPLSGAVSQKYSGFHQAIDIQAPLGTEIRPISSGRVVEKGFSLLGYGNMVVIEHENNLFSRYAHLKEIKVTSGEAVAKDTVIGTVGVTGWATGPHLHLEILQNSRSLNPQSVLPEFN
jgi:murein DD-endopeptidase MepM/ murein hydrolase activator NlpD